MPEEFIRIKTSVTEHAQSAYNSQNYIEAIQVLHGWIENKLQEILILTGSIDYNIDQVKTWDIANQISLVTSAKMLFIISKITEHEYQKLTKFNQLRNQVIHKIFHEPYEKIYKGIPKNQFDDVFKIGMELAEKLQRKTEEMIE